MDLLVTFTTHVIFMRQSKQVVATLCVTVYSKLPCTLWLIFLHLYALPRPFGLGYAPSFVLYVTVEPTFLPYDLYAPIASC